MARWFLILFVAFAAACLCAGCAADVLSPRQDQDQRAVGESGRDTTIDQSQNDPQPWLTYSLKRDAVFMVLAAAVVLVIWRTRYSREKWQYERRRNHANGTAGSDNKWSTR